MKYQPKPTGKWMYTHTVRRQEGGEIVETRTNVSRHIYDQLLSQVISRNFLMLDL